MHDIMFCFCSILNDFSREVQYVRLGTVTPKTQTLDSADYDVVRRIPHPDYINGQYYNDIALLQLAQRVTFTEYVTPICLYSAESLIQLPPTLTAIGWGRTTPDGDVSTELRKVQLNYVTNQVCQNAYSTISKDILPFGIKERSQICAGTDDGSKDACQVSIWLLYCN